MGTPNGDFNPNVTVMKPLEVIDGQDGHRNLNG